MMSAVVLGLPGVVAGQDDAERSAGPPTATNGITASRGPSADAAAIAEFGSEQSAPITSGIFIYHDTYIHRPYTVERRGLSILINGHPVEISPEWPPFIDVVDVDPGEPPPGSSPLDAVPPGTDPRLGYWHRKYRYLLAHLRAPEAHDAYAKLLASCLNVVRVVPDPDEPDLVHVHFKNGHEIGIEMGDGRPEPVLTREQALADADQTMKRFVGSLQSGALIGILPPSLGEWSIAPQEHKAFFDILLSDLPTQARLASLHVQKFVKPTDDTLIAVLSHFKADGDELYLRFGKVPPSYAGTSAVTGRFDSVAGGSVPAPVAGPRTGLVLIIVGTLAILLLLIFWISSRQSP